MVLNGRTVCLIQKIVNMPTCPYINITNDSTYTNTDLAHYKWIYAYEILIPRMKKNNIHKNGK